MRYFAKELWSKINDCDEDTRIKADIEWRKNNTAYQQQFMEVRKHLSCRFIHEYMTRNGLHDYTIISMTVSNRSQKYLCELQLSNGIETVLIVMMGIKALCIDITSFHCCIQGKLAWGYSEFEITPDNNIQLAVLCDTHNEMRFEFESIKLIKQKERRWHSS